MPVKPFSLEFEKADNETAPHILCLSGHLDANSVEAFEEAAAKILVSGDPRVVLDLAELTYIASAGIGAIIALVQELRGGGGDLIFISPTSSVRATLELVKFISVVSEAPDRAGAVAKLGAGPGFEDLDL